VTLPFSGPRNAFQGSYDMSRLLTASPALRPHIIPAHLSKSGRATIDFADASAVRALKRYELSSAYRNAALLKTGASVGVACSKSAGGGWGGGKEAAGPENMAPWAAGLGAGEGVMGGGGMGGGGTGGVGGAGRGLCSGDAGGSGGAAGNSNVADEIQSLCAICRQCGKLDAGDFDTGDALFYCNTCWDTYEKRVGGESSGTAQTAAAAPTHGATAMAQALDGSREILPIQEHCNMLQQRIRENQITCIQGETGYYCYCYCYYYVVVACMYVYACIYVHTCYENAPVSPKNPRSAGRLVL
jgi:hypothetical protein